MAGGEWEEGEEGAEPAQRDPKAVDKPSGPEGADDEEEEEEEAASQGKMAAGLIGSRQAVIGRTFFSFPCDHVSK